MPAAGSVSPEVDRVLSPISAMLPTVGVLPLQHDLARHVVDVQEDVSEKLVSRIDRQSRGRPVKGMLVKTIRRIDLPKVPRLMRLRSRERAGIRIHPIPLIRAVLTMLRGTLRQRIIKPDEFS